MNQIMHFNFGHNNQFQCSYSTAIGAKDKKEWKKAWGLHNDTNILPPRKKKIWERQLCAKV